MRSPVDIVMGRVGGFTFREIARRTVPCFKHVIEVDGEREQLALCILIDSRYLYRFPYESLQGVAGLAAKARYLRGEMEDLRLREFQPGVCRYANRKESASA
jgi:hypothetical protein